MNVHINGDERQLTAGTTLAEVVRELTAGEMRGVAVALDGAVVPRTAWDRTTLTEGQVVEVLQAVQGG